MKIKFLLFEFVLLWVTTLMVRELVGGFTIASSFSYAAMFWLLLWVTTFVAPKIRIFLLLPNMYIFNAIIHVVLIWGVYWLCTTLIGGVTVSPVKFLTVEILGIAIKGTTLGSFGTITVVSLLIGTIYQLLIWLQSDK
jgi:hypothetical protein